MIWVDLVILGVVTLSCIISLIRGFVKESISLASWTLAFALSVALADNLALLLPGSIEQPSLRIAIAFVALFISTLLVGGLVGFLLGTLIEKTGLTGTDRMLGVLFGLFRGVIIICGIVIVGSMMDLSATQWWQQSTLLPYFIIMIKWIIPLIPDSLVHYVRF